MPGWSWADTRSDANRRTRTESKGGVKSGKDRNTAGTCFRPLPGDCAPAGGLRVGRVLFAVAQVAMKAVVVGPQALAVRGMGPGRPTVPPAHRGAFLHRGSATAATSPHASPRHTRSRVRVPHGIM